MTKHTVDQQGFSLIEVLVAMLILAIGLMSLISMQVTGIKGNATANRITTASDWGADRLEHIFALDYHHDDLRDDDSISNTSNSGGDRDGGLNDATAATADGMDTSPDKLYTIFWNVSDNSVMPDTKSIRVIIQRTVKGQTKTVTMNYLKARYM